MMFEMYHCIGCKFPKLKPFMQYIMGDIGICRECFKEIATTNDMTFEGKEFIDIVISPFLYRGVAVEILQDFKFGGQRRYGNFLTALAVERLKDTHFFDKFELIVPVPLYKNRLDERGFNQSDIIAMQLGKQIKKDVDVNALERIRETKHQSSLKGRDRIENVKNAFKVRSTNLKGKNIILVDDVYTMGETANECAKVIKNAGAQKVAVFTLCKTVIKYKSSLI